ncbi:hypothetical protein AVEN_263908-1 [Araneus ventricosus]|uniref:Uncharacterized protein n=1 Tax=Araneus ventricosus TaxID=182803 RepID=A0A4Y2RMP1_ARAVE|nr:hypothetical protein AVEN_252868-1 [Araneus ventricosus]GBN76596.1 hypothetical protein AVEN_263908-1 [Araneus ventricosus]
MSVVVKPHFPTTIAACKVSENRRNAAIVRIHLLFRRKLVSSAHRIFPGQQHPLSFEQGTGAQTFSKTSASPSHGWMTGFYMDNAETYRVSLVILLCSVLKQHKV